MIDASGDTRFVARTANEAGSVFRVSSRTIREWKAEGCPCADSNYPIADMIQWAKTHKWCKSDDPLLAGGGDSPNLEEYRKWKAKLAEADYRERSAELIPRDAMMEGLARFMGLMREAGEKLQQRFGADAYAILETALVEFDSVIEEMDSGDDDAE